MHGIICISLQIKPRQAMKLTALFAFLLAIPAYADFQVDASIKEKIIAQGVPSASLEKIIDWMSGKHGTTSVQRVYSCKKLEITNLKPCDYDDRVPYTKEVSIVSHRYAVSIDFSLPSTKPRLYFIDLKTGNVETTLVTHGKGSGDLYATKFSNVLNSGTTSLGIYKVGEKYKGSHGETLRLYGLENSNDAAYERDIVMHGADYADPKFFKRINPKTKMPFTRLGLSQGCPAVAYPIIRKYLPLLENGGMIDHYYPEDSQR